MFTCSVVSWKHASLALKGKDDDTPENPKPVAAAENPSTSQATTPGVAKAAPRKVVILPPEPFTLDAKALAILQSMAPEHAKAKESLLEHAVRAVELKIEGPLALPDDTTALMAPFVSVKAFCMGGLCDPKQSAFVALRRQARVSCSGVSDTSRRQPSLLVLHPT